VREAEGGAPQEKPTDEKEAAKQAEEFTPPEGFYGNLTDEQEGKLKEVRSHAPPSAELTASTQMWREYFKLMKEKQAAGVKADEKADKDLDDGGGEGEDAFKGKAKDDAAKDEQAKEKEKKELAAMIGACRVATDSTFADAARRHARCRWLPVRSHSCIPAIRAHARTAPPSGRPAVARTPTRSCSASSVLANDTSRPFASWGYADATCTDVGRAFAMLAASLSGASSRASKRSRRRARKVSAMRCGPLCSHSPLRSHSAQEGFRLQYDVGELRVLAPRAPTPILRLRQVLHHGYRQEGPAHRLHPRREACVVLHESLYGSDAVADHPKDQSQKSLERFTIFNVRASASQLNSTDARRRWRPRDPCSPLAHSVRAHLSSISPTLVSLTWSVAFGLPASYSDEPDRTGNAFASSYVAVARFVRGTTP
jgi:hypothetical protein